MASRPIFRQRALDEYRRGTERDVVPRLISAPIITCCWVLLVVLVATAVVAWWVRVPEYVAAPGAIAAAGVHLDARSATTSAVLFVPLDRAAQLHVGQPVRGQVGSSGRFVRGTVATVLRPPVGPAAARARYRLPGADVIDEPARAVTVRLATTLPASAYAGARLDGRVQVGRRRLLAFLPGLGNLFGGG